MPLLGRVVLAASAVVLLSVASCGAADDVARGGADRGRGCAAAEPLPLDPAGAEYHESLRNAHLPAGDQDVWVAAGVRGSDGQVHEVRRELVCDFAQGTECASRLLVDGVEQRDLAAFALAPAEGSALGAPVLLQHTLRHVLSTQPKDRVAYFKSLLSLTETPSATA